MQVYIEKELVMIPMALNSFYYNIPFGAKKIVFSKTVSISEEFMEILLNYINELPTEKHIILDLENIDYAFKLFEEFQKINRPLIFININTQSLREKIKENLPGIQLDSKGTNGTLNAYFNKSVLDICSQYSSCISHKVYVKIVKELIDKVKKSSGEPHKLDSSGLYSNMYVNVKKLFLEPECYYAIVYGLARKIVDSDIEFDGFVSSSKNGALLANLLGMLLDKKVIHIMGIGPKYSMNIGNVQKEIKKRKNYICIFDFRCTGTEMKILSALINANDAYVQGYAGIAVYKYDLKDVSENIMLYLVDIKDEEIPYKIAGEKEDLIKLMDD
ncbi:hypothetical protein B5E77_16475 [Lachnoclostridium sp. An131]|uniref:hypothetical protein n=1 Tax=Lachnoclostridium sp. An131 TaxID=1965555 RepID=UPI000B380A00|nr:hypothetical protein [Lachnoclostridium sp. An131]OUQ22675.1 hypothetical protein B5E77_16475 [Lachnoclostridium sp. An131]